MILGNCWVVTMDDAGTEHERGWIRIEDGLVAELGAGEPRRRTREDLGGAVVTPGLRQHAPPPVPDADARARAAGRPLHVAEDALPDAGRASTTRWSTQPRARGLAELALSGCTTVFDHHYVFPRGVSGLVEAEIRAAQELGVRIVASRGSMDLGESDGGLPPDSLVEDIDDDPRRHRAARTRSPTATSSQIAVAPCSPFSRHDAADGGVGRARAPARAAAAHASRRDDRGGRVLPRALRLHAGRVPRARRLDRRRRVVRALRAPLRRRRRRRSARAGVGVAHCPTSNLRLGAGVAPVRDLLDAGVRVGLGVDGSASNERSDLFVEVKHALLVARGRGGGAALTARDALRLGTRGGADVLRRDDIGSLEPGKRADLAVWRTDGLEFGGADDLVANLVLSGPHRVDRLLVGGERRRARRRARAAPTSRRSRASTANRRRGCGGR